MRGARRDWIRVVEQNRAHNFHCRSTLTSKAACGIESQPTNSNTPTANSIIEAAHKTVGRVVRLVVHQFPPTTKKEAQLLVQQAFGQAMHATRCPRPTVIEIVRKINCVLIY